MFTSEPSDDLFVKFPRKMSPWYSRPILNSIFPVFIQGLPDDRERSFSAGILKPGPCRSKVRRNGEVVVKERPDLRSICLSQIFPSWAKMKRSYAELLSDSIEITI